MIVRTSASKSMITMAVIIATSGIAAESSRALAAPASVSLQLYGGARSVHPNEQKDATEAQQLEKSKIFTGGEFGIATMIAPVPLVPVSIGVYATRQTFKGDSKQYVETFDGIAGGVQLMGWLDLGLVAPFLKGGYDLYSQHTYTIKYDDSSSGASGKVDAKQGGKVNGYHIAVGFNVKPLPYLAGFIEADFAQQTFQVDEVSSTDGRFTSGLRLNEQEKKNFNRVLKSQAILIGVDLGN